MNVSRFWSLFFLFTISVIASLFIALHGNWDKIDIAFSSINFWVAVATSIILSIVLIVAVYSISKWLDNQYSWQKSKGKRAFLQFICGVLVPAVIDLFIMWIYFRSLGSDLYKSEFLLVDYPVVVSFIVIVNFWFLIVQLFSQSNMLDTQKDQINFDLTINYKRIDIRFNVAKDILYFYRCGRKVLLLTNKGREYPIDQSISKLKDLFEDAGFLQINRALLINSNIVKSYQSPSDIKRNTLIVVFKPQFQSFIENPESDLFEITGGYLDDFKKKFEEN